MIFRWIFFGAASYDEWMNGEMKMMCMRKVIPDTFNPTLKQNSRTDVLTVNGEEVKVVTSCLTPKLTSKK